MQLFQLLQFAVGIATGVWLAQAGVPTTWISVYESMVFLSGLFCFFWVAGGQNTLLQLIPKLNDPASVRTALFSTYLLLVLVSALTGLALWMSEDYLVAHTASGESLRPVIPLAAWYLFLNGPAYFIHIYYLLIGKYRRIVVFGLVSGLWQLTAVVLPVALGMTMRSVWVSLVAWAAFRSVWGLVLWYRHTTWRWNGGFIRRLMPMSVPLVLLAFIGKGSEYVSGFIVSTRFADERSFALFRYGAREFPLAVLLVGALSTSLLPEITADLDRGLARIKYTTLRLSHWLFPVSILSIFLSPILFPIVFNDDFAAAAQIFNTYTLLLTSRILLPQIVTMGHHRNYLVALSAAVEFGVVAALCWWWADFGLTGVAAGVVVGFLVDRVILLWYNWRKLGVSPARYVHLPSYLAYNLLLWAAYLLSF
ncbi:MAG: hypothetical protein RLY31_3246 [Bacteroidota bacterium]